jgi:hypothetical protein
MPSASTHTQEETHRKHIPPIYEDFSNSPANVATQLRKYLDLNFSLIQDKACPNYQFLCDWKDALEDILDLIGSTKIELRDRTAYIYPICGTLSRRLVMRQNDHRVKHWQDLACKLKVNKQYSCTKWWKHYDALRKAYPQANQVSIITCQAITMHDLICANSLRP